MKYTNKLNLPEVFDKIIKEKESKEFIENRYSVTEFLKPTKEIKLTRLHYDELECDISESINVIFGSAVHKIFEENSNHKQSEVKYEVNLTENDTLVGILDYSSDKIISDYKTATVSKVLKQDFEDYKKQILMYAWLKFKTTGIISRKGNVYILMKDWSKIKSVTVNNYPQSAIYVYSFDIEDSDYDYIINYIYDKLKEIKHNEIPDCSDEDRWYTGTKYAVYKKAGDKKAFKIFDSEQEAHNCITNDLEGTGEIQVRKGEYTKCKYYCNCNKFCNQYKEE